MLDRGGVLQLDIYQRYILGTSGYADIDSMKHKHEACLIVKYSAKFQYDAACMHSKQPQYGQEEDLLKFLASAEYSAGKPHDGFPFP